jgi:hypothetical protein
VTQQCGGGPELRKAFDSGEDSDNGERDQVGEVMPVKPARLALHLNLGSLAVIAGPIGETAGPPPPSRWQ